MRTVYVAAASMIVGAVISGITVQRLAAQAKPPSVLHRRKRDYRRSQLP